MTRVLIKKNGVITYKGEFKTLVLAQQWVIAQSNANSFGDIYTIEYVDITQEIDMQNKMMVRSKKRSFGLMMIDKIAIINQSKALTTTEVESFMLNPIVQILKAHLDAGNIDTFVDRLSNTDVSVLFTNEEKSSVLTECNNFLNGLEV